MKTTISVIKADIGSIGGHITPSKEVLATVKKYIQNNNKDIIDFFINHTGDDIAILMTHTHGKNNKKIHSLGWNALVAGSKKAKEQGLYGAGQDIFEESFTGNVQGMGPAVAELEFEERPGEPFLFFAADKTEPGAYNLPLYLSFADPMHCPGLMLSPSMDEGFRFVIIDIKHTDAQRTIELNAPEDLYDIAALLRDNSRFIVQSIWSRKTREQAVAVS
ncbi:fructose 1,6-bisphosphatase, partial [bacterium]|nr:fructose 1,6-bisphosphatase [bacterium]